MFQELKFQLSTALLTILTLAAGVSAIINFQQQNRFQLPEDGVIWVERKGAVEALYVKTGGPGFNGGIHVGDRLLSIDGVPIQKATDVTKVLVRIGPWSKAQYQVLSRGVEVKPTLVIAAAPMDRAVMYQYLVGAAYLLIGLFVYFRRSSAHKAQHFYILSLTSFIFFTFHYTGHLDSFDKVIYFGNLLGGLIAPTVFLHFCLTFPEPRPWIASKTRMALLYVPAAIFFLIYIGFTSGVMSIAVPLIELRWMLDRAWVVFATLPYLIGGFALSAEYHRTEDTVTRQQLKWLRNGAFSGILPFALFYVLPYALGVVPNAYMKMTVLSVVLIPLTLSYAIVRYRLMDVDIIFRRGYAYTMATVCVLAGFYGIVFGVGRLVNQRFSDLGNTGLMVVMLTTAFLFQPIRNWIQERLDMRFYRDRYDYRRTLVEFARELTSETDLDTMLHSVGDRLLETLQIKHLTFFLAEDTVGATGFQLKKSMGPNPRMTAASSEELDLSFLNEERAEPYLFFERTRHQLDAVSRALPPAIRRTIADLDLTYYMPCKVRARTIAFIGLSRTITGDYLSSIDVELLMMLAGYVGIAIENSALYRSLQHKVEEYERLKEFSENIVESINVGILAVDLEDRVESWNTQIEHLTGITREQALGRRLAEVFPAELTDQFDRVRGDDASQIITPTQTDFCGNDIALLILKDNVAASEAPNVTPELWYAMNDPSARKAGGLTLQETAIGFGVDDPNNINSAGIRRIKEDIALQCIPGDPQIDCGPVSQSGVATNEFASGDGTCEGDSGSSAYEQSHFDQSQWTSYGVLSRGGVSGNSCVASVYTRLDKWSDLITSTAQTAATAGGYPLPTWATNPFPDGGAQTDGGDADTGVMTGPANPLGSPCSASSDCASSLCVSQFNDNNYVCSATCDAMNPCAGGLVCYEGYCFASAPDAGAKTPLATTTTSSGCSLAPGGPSSAADGAFAFVGLALTAGLGRRRRRAA